MEPFNLKTNKVEFRIIKKSYNVNGIDKGCYELWFKNEYFPFGIRWQRVRWQDEDNYTETIEEAMEIAKQFKLTYIEKYGINIREFEL